MTALTLPALKNSASSFLQAFKRRDIPKLFGVTDGKAIGTYVEHAFYDYLQEHFAYSIGSSSSGIDFPTLNVDLKVTSLRQPQSSCPFQSASQKIYGLGYHLLVFVYDKSDDAVRRLARLNIVHAIFIDKERTADYQTTRGLRDILERDGNQDDIEAFLMERNLPLDEIGRVNLARRILDEPPALGYLTVSNALQWRLQYSRVIALAEEGMTDGLENLLKEVR